MGYLDQHGQVEPKCLFLYCMCPTYHLDCTDEFQFDLRK